MNIVTDLPVGYSDMLVPKKNARKILTSSKRVQKEAYFFEVSRIILRRKQNGQKLLKMPVKELIAEIPEREDLVWWDLKQIKEGL